MKRMALQSHHAPAITSETETPSQYFLRELFRMTNYSLQELAKELGISITTIRRLQTGVIRDPRHITFKRILYNYCHFLCR